MHLHNYIPTQHILQVDNINNMFTNNGFQIDIECVYNSRGFFLTQIYL